MAFYIFLENYIFCSFFPQHKFACLKQIREQRQENKITYVSTPEKVPFECFGT